MNDQLAPAQFDKRVLLQETKQRLLIRQSQQRRIGSAVLLSQLKRVNHAMPTLLQPMREAARQLGINQPPEARCGERWPAARQTPNTR